eukprot:2301169-Pleurochrysis_carterae.AAC.2
MGTPLRRRGARATICARSAGSHPHVPVAEPLSAEPVVLRRDTHDAAVATRTVRYVARDRVPRRKDEQH